MSKPLSLAVPSTRPALEVAAAIRLAYSRWRQRCALAELDERLLRDIGRDRIAAGRECAKAPWQP